MRRVISLKERYDLPEATDPEEGGLVDPKSPNFTKTDLDPNVYLPDSSGTLGHTPDQQGIRGELYSMYLKGRKARLIRDAGKRQKPGPPKMDQAYFNDLVSSWADGYLDRDLTRRELDKAWRDYRSTGEAWVRGHSVPLGDEVLEQWDEFGAYDTPGRHAASLKRASVRKTAWSFNPQGKYYEASSSITKFTCPSCNHDNEIGFSRCACGKTWNSYTVEASTGTKIRCIEVKQRDGVVLSSRRKKPRTRSL